MSKKMSKNNKVIWSWGKGQAEGEIVQSFTDHVAKKIKGSTIKKKASKDNPAYLIKQENGNKVLKLQSEIAKK